MSGAAPCPTRSSRGSRKCSAKPGIPPFFCRPSIAPACAASKCGFGANDGKGSAGAAAITVTPEDHFVALLYWIRYRGRALGRRLRRSTPGLAAAGAATFLKHKLWRIRNTGHPCCSGSLCPESQVVDQPVLYALEARLARLLLVGMREAVLTGGPELHAEMHLTRSSDQ